MRIRARVSVVAICNFCLSNIRSQLRDFRRTVAIRDLEGERLVGFPRPSPTVLSNEFYLTGERRESLRVHSTRIRISADAHRLWMVGGRGKEVERHWKKAGERRHLHVFQSCREADAWLRALVIHINRTTTNVDQVRKIIAKATETWQTMISNNVIIECFIHNPVRDKNTQKKTERFQINVFLPWVFYTARSTRGSRWICYLEKHYNWGSAGSHSLLLMTRVKFCLNERRAKTLFIFY